MRRCFGSPWRLLCPFIVVLFGGVLSEANKGPLTSCDYQVGGVTKPCELFHEIDCRDITSKPADIEDGGMVGGDVDNTSYWNFTFTFWHTEGFVKQRQLNMCWQFKIGSTLYPEEFTNMNLDFLPYTSEGLTLYTDVERCFYVRNYAYTLQAYRLEDPQLKFILQPVPGIREVYLTLAGGKCEVKCDGSVSDCPVSTEYKTMRNFSEPVFFTNLTERYYCIHVEDTHNCRAHTATIKMEDPLPPPTPITQEKTTPIVLIVFAIMVIVIILVVLFVKKMCSYGPFHKVTDAEEEESPIQWHYTHQQWASSPASQKILLLYSRESPQFCEVVQALRQILQSFGNIKVMDPLEQSQIEQVSENISGWLTKHLYNPDIKLVVVMSEGAVIRQNALLNNLVVQINEPHFLDPIFTQALRQMHDNPKIGNDYRRIFPVRFEDFTPSDVSLSLIVPHKCYVLQKHLGKLIVELRNFNSQTEPDLEDIRSICPQEMNQLEFAIKNMKAYCADNPYYVKNHFSLVVPSTQK